jgi:hypothetical protein
MNNFMHKRIKRFELSGQILDDIFIPRMKQEYTRLLCEKMKEEGYIVRLDIDPDWSISYTGNYYEFTLSVYGSHIGKKSAACIDGLDKNRPIYTPQSKSGESSQGLESQLNQK